MQSKKSRRPRRTHSPELKKRAVQKSYEPGQPVSVIAGKRVMILNIFHPEKTGSKLIIVQQGIIKQNKGQAF